jgi:hypothetical protein
MITGSCHCGAVTFELRETPEWITECNCSICRRLATLWAHSQVDKVTITGAPEATIAYCWGDRDLEFHSCRICGCTTHWAGCSPDFSHRVALNCRLAPPEEIAGIRVRRFDGATSWSYLD